MTVEEFSVKLIVELERQYEKSEKDKITKNNRCKWARENETLGESQARRQGFLSGLLFAIDLCKRITKEATDATNNY